MRKGLNAPESSLNLGLASGKQIDDRLRRSC
jgi:hypothetical protein